MSKLAQLARSGTNKEAFGVSTTLAVSSGFILPTVQSAMTLTVHEILNNERLRPVGMIALGITTLAANLVSLYVESKALKEKGYSNSPVTTGAFKLTEKPKLVALASHIYHLAILGLINPVNIVTFVNILNGNQAERLVIENALSIATINAGWNILTDGLIWKDKIKPLAETLEKVNNKIVKTVKPLVNRITDDAHLYFDG